jgi:polysaccharide biosynthesis/export protein
MTKKRIFIALLMAVSTVVSSTAFAQTNSTTRRTDKPTILPPPPPPPVEPDYRIGPDDILMITVWKEETASGEVVVRPDGKITLKLGDEIVAAGLTTDELRKKVEEQIKKFYEEPIPAVQVQVKAILSRKICILGAVNKVGCYPLTGPTTVSQLISMAGGLLEWAKKKEIQVISATLKDKTGQPLAYKVNYEEIEKGRNLAKNNIELRPGDQIIVPGGQP